MISEFPWDSLACVLRTLNIFMVMIRPSPECKEGHINLDRTF